MNQIHRGWQRCLVAAALSGLGGVGCVGDEGATGATGPAGDDGDKGDKGDKGDPGDTGDTGDTGNTGDTGDTGPAGRTPLLRLLDADFYLWYGDNRDRLNQLITDHGASSAAFDPENRPVAVFDWDNTVIKNDIGDATMFWLINNDKILQPPARDWSQTNAHLTTEARDALNAACDALAEPGEPLPTGSNTACADEIFDIYDGSATSGGADAWDDQAITSTINQAYAWVAQLLAGYRPDEVRAFAQAALYENLDATQGAHQTVGSHDDVTGWIRIYAEMEDLIRTLQDNGFDVWIVSASPQYVVEPAAFEVGVDRDRVIGIRTVSDHGVLTSDLQGCGDVADGDNTLITFDRGKRCWINYLIFNELPEAQMEQNPDLARRPVFVAGDSDTDIAMLKDATALRLVLNRNKPQIMCNAYANHGDSWLVQPMFINPKAQKVAGYDCAAGTDNDGNPMVDETGAPIAHQDDTVFELPVRPD